MISPTDLIMDLRSRGFTVSARNGKVYIKPSSKLATEDVARIREKRDFLLQALTVEQEGVPQDELDQLFPRETLCRTTPSATQA